MTLREWAERQREIAGSIAAAAEDYQRGLDEFARIEGKGYGDDEPMMDAAKEWSREGLADLLDCIGKLDTESPKGWRMSG